MHWGCGIDGDENMNGLEVTVTDMDREQRAKDYLQREDEQFRELLAGVVARYRASVREYVERSGFGKDEAGAGAVGLRKYR